jgi:hypothetical protein
MDENFYQKMYTSNEEEKTIINFKGEIEKHKKEREEKIKECNTIFFVFEPYKKKEEDKIKNIKISIKMSENSYLEEEIPIDEIDG